MRTLLSLVDSGIKASTADNFMSNRSLFKMYLGRLFPRGLASLNLSARRFLTSRGTPLRIVRVCVAADGNGDDLPEQEHGKARVPGSRRTLFKDAAPPAPAESTTSMRELLDIHAQSLQDSGTNLSPLEIQKNRLHSVRTSLRRETRGPARAAVSREFRMAERRLHSSMRRPRQEEQVEAEAGENYQEAGGRRQQQQERRAAAEEYGDGVRNPKGPKATDRKRSNEPSPEAKERAAEFAARNAARYVAAHTAYKRQKAKAAAAAARSDDDDDDDEEDAPEGEIEGEEMFSLENQIMDLQGRPGGRGRQRDFTEEGGPFQGPKLTHDLPPEVNLRLLQTILMGSRNSSMPEIPLGTSGITNGVISAILLAWRGNELVKLRVRDKRKVAKKYLPYIRQVCDVIESRSGGVVVWRSGRSIWVYRGEDYTPSEPGKIKEELLGKAEVPIYVQELSAKQPLFGQKVTLPQGTVGYLTRGSAGLLVEDPAGAPAPPHGLGVIFLHDAFGVGSSDTQQHCKQVCDMLSSVVGPGTPVLMPDLTPGDKDMWRGPVWPPGKPIFERQNGWLANDARGNPAAVAPYVEAAVSYMLGPEVGASRIVLVGTGWGGWLALNMLAADAAKLQIEAEAEAEVEAEVAAATAAAEATPAAAAVTTATDHKPTGTKGSKVVAGKSAAPDPRVLGKAARHMMEVMKRELPEEAGPLQRGLWMLYGPQAKGYRQAKVLARYGGRRPRQVDPDVYRGEGLIFSAGVVGSPSHFFGDEERMALAMSVPLCFVCSKWDPMEKFQLYMMPPLVDQCAFKRFGKITPGFWGKQAQWSDPVQARQATQATELAGWFLRWHMANDETAQERVRKFCMMGKSGVGEKQTTNLGFPWLEQVLLYSGHEKQREQEMKLKRQELGLPEVVTKKELAKKAWREAKKQREAAMREREAGREWRPEREAGRSDGRRDDRDRYDGRKGKEYGGSDDLTSERWKERGEDGGRAQWSRTASPPHGERWGGRRWGTGAYDEERPGDRRPRPPPQRESSWSRREYRDYNDTQGRPSSPWQGRGSGRSRRWEGDE
ncbi:hypothetical protein Vafri_19719 [Volvox africanus]|uniref:CRM domain-containing protein n=1 Tax=Volvox africanus TaxID=51714 RepID=A0A8J4BQU9_9CHLO|nr:hypothetical protein Vafri_19719 [Volvox africanus]